MSPAGKDSLLIRIDDPGSDHSVWVEDDGETAYAYLARGDEGFVGDVWLYNRVDAPIVPPWRTGAQGPFVNAAAYVRADIAVEPVESADEVTVTWGRSEGLGTVARIHLHGLLHAIVRTDVRPGWCALAKADGPLARRLTPGCELSPETGVTPSGR